MTLDEAIRHAEEVADGYDRIKKIKAVTEYECQCAREHRQLAEWLKDYKRLLEQKPCTDAISRQDALDALGLSEKTRKYGGDHSGYETIMLYEVQDIIEQLPSVSVCTDAISRKQEIEAFEKRSGMNWERLKILEPLLEEIENLPSVSVCADAISIGNVIEWLKNKDIIKLSTQEKIARKELRELQSISVAEKTGRWIARGLVDINGNRMYECSECHHSDTQAATMIVPYCWYCGAKMEVEE